MTTVKNIAQGSSGFKFMIDDLKIMSPAGRKHLFNQRMMTSGAAIEKEIGLLSQMISFIEKKEFSGVFDEIGNNLSRFKDIHATVSNLSNGHILDDIDLFELKHFSMLSEEIASLFKSIQCAVVKIPELEQVVRILDPEDQKIPHFYIYSTYSHELGEVRRQLKGTGKSDPDRYVELREKELLLEERVRKELSERLFPFSEKLDLAFKALSVADVLIAKSRQALEMRLCRPGISDTKTEYKSLFNPFIKSLLEKENKKFQSVDIALHQGPVLVTGANMGGKTVLLKTLYLAQHLFQFGFYVPAEKAAIMPVGEVLMSQGENQPELAGLSSFAFEMQNVDRIIQAVRSGKKVLALVDELARTTNPDEGKAIVNATLDILSENKVCSVITSHYSGIEAKCRKLRVRGLMADKMKGAVNFENLNDFMDYSLTETDSAGSSSDGIRIAEIMGIDGELIEKAKWYFDRER